MQPFDGDADRFHLGIEARLGPAYEHDPYCALSIARVDPLPHQLDAVDSHFLALPRLRFRLATRKLRNQAAGHQSATCTRGKLHTLVNRCQIETGNYVFLAGRTQCRPSATATRMGD